METKNSKGKIIGLLSISILVLVVVIFYLFTKMKNTKYNDSEVLANSKYGVVTAGEVKKYLKVFGDTFKQEFDFSKITKELKELIVREIVNDRIVLEQAKKSNTVNSKEYKEKLAEFESALLKETYLQEKFIKNITDEDVKKKYAEIKEELEKKKEFKVKHIVVKTEEQIKEVVNKLKTDSFENVAKQYSIDTTKNKGGDLGFILEGQVDTEFDKVLKNTAFNRVSNPFKTKFGWHVIIKEKERAAIIPKFEDSKAILKNVLVAEILKKNSDENLKNSELKLVE